jgi:hypothetical protein
MAVLEFISEYPAGLSYRQRFKVLRDKAVRTTKQSGKGSTNTGLASPSIASLRLLRLSPRNDGHTHNDNNINNMNDK